MEFHKNDNLIRIIFLLIFTVSLVNSKVENHFHGQKRFVVQHINEDVYQHMQELQTTEDRFDFWLLSRNQSVLLVPDRYERVLQQRLINIGAPYQIYDDENYSYAEDGIDFDSEESFESLQPLKRQTRQIGGFFGRYQRYNSIVSYVKSLTASYPQYARYVVGGVTSEGRRIVGISITANRRARKLIYIQGGAHAREWISVSTALYMIGKLLSNFPYYGHFLRDTEIVFIPVVNPDGYEFSHIYQRLWRKNTRTIYSGTNCHGADLNRNFGYYWNTVGASNSICSEIYAGPGAFSEPETRWIQSYLLANRFRTKLVLDLHSYGQYLLYPYGFTSASAPTRNFLHSVAYRVSQAIYQYRRTRYIVGSSAQVLYAAAGGLDDYAYGVLGVPLSYTMELPGVNFDPSTSQIIPTGEETFLGLVEFMRIVSGLR